MRLQKRINILLEKKRVRILLIVLIILFVIRLILPHVVLHYANKTLRNLKGYSGHVADINVGIFRGAYTIKKLYLHKKDSVSGEESEFFDVSLIDLSVHWKELLHGKIVGEIELENPVLRFVKDKTEPKQLQKDSADYKMVLDKFMPLRINRFEITNGMVKYIDNSSSPKVNLSL